MTYAVINCINGTYSVFAEVMIADEYLDAVEGCKEFIHHEPTAPAPETEGE